MTTLPIADMLRDADTAWGIFESMAYGPGLGWRTTAELFGNLSCHIRALAAENERLRAEGPPKG